jgi:hypothetical protein
MREIKKDRRPSEDRTADNRKCMNESMNYSNTNYKQSVDNCQVDGCEAALGYADSGLSVLPIKAGSKEPAGTLAPRGHNSATTDAAAVRAWFETRPNLNVGIRTGFDTSIGRGVAVIDIDPRNGGDTSLSALEARHGRLPDTRTVSTPSGGRHYYYLIDQPLRGCELAAGIDLKADGGYVVAPPSRVTTAKGDGCYRLGGSADIASLPDWVRDAVEDRTSSRRAEPLPGKILGGARNSTLTSAAGAMRRRDFSEAAILQALLIENDERCEPPLPEDEVRRIAESVSRYEPEQSGYRATSEPRRFQLVSAADVLNMPASESLIDGYLVQDSIATLYGPSGGGKSFMALDISLHVAGGKDWHGCETSGGPVVYIASEGASGLGQRLQAWQKYHKTETPERMSFLLTPANLRDKAESDAFMEVLREMPEPPKLVVIDTLAWAMVGGDENSVKDVMLVMDSARRIRDEFGATVLIIHHTGKNGDAERGSSSLRAGSDTMLKLTADGERMTLEVDKQKDGPIPEARHFVRREMLIGNEDDMGTSCVIEPASATTVGKLTDSARKVLAALRDSFTAEEGATSTQWEKVSSLPERTFQNARKALVEGGYVRKDGRHYKVTGRAAEAAITAMTLPNDCHDSNHKAGDLLPAMPYLLDMAGGSKQQWQQTNPFSRLSECG